MSTFLRRKSGVTSVEYGLLAALIAIVCIAFIGSTGFQLEKLFGYIGYKILSPAYSYQPSVSTSGSISCSYKSTVEGFTDQYGNVITPDGCFSGESQTTAMGHLQYDMANDQGLYLFNNQGKTVIVPPVFGQSTNFTVQNGDEVLIYSDALNSSTNVSFSIKTKTGSISSQNLSGAALACKNSGGNLTIDSTNNVALCSGGQPAGGEILGVIQ